MTSPDPASKRRWLLRARKGLLALCLIAWASALVASHLPPDGLPEVHLGDKGLHVAGFFVLTGLFWLTLASHGRRRIARVTLTLLVLPLYAALDELTQPWFRRNADVHDWLADLAGAACALLVAEAAASLFRRRAPEGS